MRQVPAIILTINDDVLLLQEQNRHHCATTSLLAAILEGKTLDVLVLPTCTLSTVQANGPPAGIMPMAIRQYRSMRLCRCCSCPLSRLGTSRSSARMVRGHVYGRFSNRYYNSWIGSHGERRSEAKELRDECHNLIPYIYSVKQRRGTVVRWWLDSLQGCNYYCLLGTRLIDNGKVHSSGPDRSEYRAAVGTRLAQVF